jgi:hypothetical protein
MVKISWVFSIFILGYFIFITALVPTSTGISVSGSLFVENVTPGQHLQHNMTVESEATGPGLDYTATVIGYNQSLEGVNLEVPPESDLGPYTARPFLNVSPSRFHLKPGGSQDLVLQGDVPKDAAPGERYAFVSICSSPVGSGTMAIQSAVDVLVELLVTGGDIVRKGEITSLDVIKPISSEQQNISLIFRNTGDYRYRAKAQVQLESKDGQILGNASAQNYNSIIPKVSRRFEFFIKPKAALKPGSYYVNATVTRWDGTVLAEKRSEFKV